MVMENHVYQPIPAVGMKQKCSFGIQPAAGRAWLMPVIDGIHDMYAVSQQ